MKSILLVFLLSFSCTKLDYHFSLQKIRFQEIFSISCFMWDVRHWCNLWDDTTHTPRQAWIIKCGIHLSWKAACTKHMSKFSSSSLAMLLEWTFLHPTFTKYTTNKLYLFSTKKGYYIIQQRLCKCHTDLLPDDSSSKQFCNPVGLSITWTKSRMFATGTTVNHCVE